MVTILYVHQPFQDIEVTLVDGREGRFVALPQRQYGDENDRKYKKLVYLHNPSVLTAMKEAIEASMKSPAADEEDDRPF
jgi:DNA-binding cell septation regulator SpoVG